MPPLFAFSIGFDCLTGLVGLYLLYELIKLLRDFLLFLKDVLNKL